MYDNDIQDININATYTLHADMVKGNVEGYVCMYVCIVDILRNHVSWRERELVREGESQIQHDCVCCGVGSLTYAFCWQLRERDFVGLRACVYVECVCGASSAQIII